MFLVAINCSKIDVQNKAIKNMLFCVYIYIKLFKYLFCKTVSFYLDEDALLIMSNVKSLISELVASQAIIKW